MSKNFSRQKSRKIRKQRSKTPFGNLQKPRVIISKSNRYLTIQAVDDDNQKTLIYNCTKNLNSTNNKNYKNKKAAESLGEIFAKSLLEKNIKKIFFDRNGYIYGGNIGVLCSKMRELGIIF